MVDLGPYAAEVLSAYAVTLILLAGLILLSLRRSLHTKRALITAEERARHA